MAQEFYREEEAEAILRLAAQRTSGDGISRERLLATASELGISQQAVEDAELALVAQRRDRELRHEYASQVRGDLYTHLIAFVVVNLFLTVLNLSTSPGHFWAGWVIGSWGLGLLIHLWLAAFKRSSLYGAGFEDWRARRLGEEAPSHQRRGLVVGISIGHRPEQNPQVKQGRSE
jgi:hypothetical protein